jgi:hypothetical protein
MTETLAVEWARANININVNAIAPGAFHSEMMDGMIARIGDFSQTTPRKRLGEPAQLDSTLLYLVSPASDAVTGACIGATTVRAAGRRGASDAPPDVAMGGVKSEATAASAATGPMRDAPQAVGMDQASSTPKRAARKRPALSGGSLHPDGGSCGGVEF